MSNNLTSTNAVYAELNGKRAKYDQKKCDSESMAANIAIKLSGMELAHSILEKRYLADEVSISQVSASRAEIETESRKLEEVERLCEIARNAIKEIDGQIQQALQSVAAARRDFCLTRRNDLFREIKLDAKLRTRLKEAMAAHAMSGSGSYTWQADKFIQSFLSSITPDITELEAREAGEKFTKSNNL